MPRARPRRPVATPSAGSSRGQLAVVVLGLVVLAVLALNLQSQRLHWAKPPPPPPAQPQLAVQPRVQPLLQPQLQPRPPPRLRHVSVDAIPPTLPADEPKPDPQPERPPPQPTPPPHEPELDSHPEPRQPEPRAELPESEQLVQDVAPPDPPAVRLPFNGRQYRTLASQPPIIIGGTDGSGTRGGVSLLLSMDVLMLSDAGGASDCQYDVHGLEANHQGWPPVVAGLLEHTHAADYDPADLPTRPQEDTTAALMRLAKAFRQRVQKKLDADAHPERYARWGFKAPVTMYLVPFWAKVFPGCSFVHVVRDGRDMAFHWLQSPVKRYWPGMFPKQFQQLSPRERAPNQLIPDHGSYIGKAYVFDVERPGGPQRLNPAPHFRIAELWAKSNLEVQAAGHRLVWTPSIPTGPGQPNSERPHLASFVTVRSEDFVTTEDRFHAASRALLWAVRPELTEHEICCQLRSHWSHEQASPGWVKNMKNYGKWRGAIAQHGGQNGEFYRGIFSRSHDALAAFGYLDDTWHYGSQFEPDLGACHAVSDCRQRPPHKQKCMG